MAFQSKKAKKLAAAIDSEKLYGVSEAIALVKEHATAKFDESIDVAVNLGVDAKKSDQLVRGSVVLPSGTGKTVRVAVFADGVEVHRDAIRRPSLVLSAIAPADCSAIIIEHVHVRPQGIADFQCFLHKFGLVLQKWKQLLNLLSSNHLRYNRALAFLFLLNKVNNHLFHRIYF